MSIRLVIFDCDGVLFRSEAANVAFYNEVLRQVGEPPLPAREEVAAHAMASAHLFRHFYGDQPELLARVQEVARGLDYTPFYSFMEPQPALRETLALLRRRYATAMATNRGKTTHGVLAHFDLADFFDLAVGALDVEHPKPAPDMIEVCLEHFGVAPEEAVYVGDQPLDRDAAAAAGVHFVGMDPIADEVPMRLERFDELPALVAELAAAVAS
jgi:phosphoglycolate phosphatase